MLTIENSELRAAFDETGAETVSLVELAGGRELIWQGDPAIWNGHSPLLFPITGGLWNGTARIDGRECAIPKHGFAKRRVWEVREHEAGSVAFALTPQPGDADFYPYNYELRIRYALEGRRLTATASVENKGTAPMFFQFGGHPAINLPDFDASHAVDGYLRLHGAPTHVLRAADQGCIVTDGEDAAHFDFPHDADGLIPLGVDTFAHEALIFDQPISAADVLDRNRRPLVRVASTAPVWLFWSMQGLHCPYICCEPWYGLPDLAAYEGEFARRPFMQSTAPGTTWQGGYSVEVL